AALLQDPIGRGHRGRADAEVLREIAYRRQPLTASDPPSRHGSLGAPGDLDSGSSCEIGLYYHMSDTVLEQTDSMQSPRTTVKRLAQRGAYGRDTIYGIIDE